MDEKNVKKLSSKNEYICLNVYFIFSLAVSPYILRAASDSRVPLSIIHGSKVCDQTEESVFLISKGFFISKHSAFTDRADRATRDTLFSSLLNNQTVINV